MQSGKPSGTSKNNRLVVDAVLALLAVEQMMHMLLPDEIHELCGVCLGVFVVLHVVQHRTWFASLRKGPWNARRAIGAVLIACLLLLLVGMLASGLAMSSWAVLAGATGTGVARAVHLPLVHVGFCLLAIHAGFQLPRIGSRKQEPAQTLRIVGLAACAVLCAVGLWSLADLNFAGYITGSVGFEFIDPSKPLLLHGLQYLSIFVLFATLGRVGKMATQR